MGMSAGLNNGVSLTAGFVETRDISDAEMAGWYKRK
jgi:hypothetical protein